MQKAGLWAMAAGMGLAALVMWENAEPIKQETRQEVVDRNSFFSDNEYGIVGELLTSRDDTGSEETFSEQEEPDIPKVGRTKGFMPDGMPSVSVSPF